MGWHALHVTRSALWPQLRQDPFTHEWTVMAPERARRTQPTPVPVPALSGVDFDPHCPFCTGIDNESPGELWRTPAAKSGQRWAVRVVPNRYPALVSGEHAVRRRSGFLYNSAEGMGAHEVVIESPRHDADLPDRNDAGVTDVLRAYRARARALRGLRPGLVLPFRNHGGPAGSSLPHPHSQIVATPVVPQRFRQLFDVARRHYDDYGSCLYVDVAAAEIAEGTRVIAATEDILVFAPYASTVPYETWLLPRTHQACFADADDELLVAAARLLRDLLRGLRRVLGDVPYNYVVVSAPNDEEHTAYFTWHLQLLPRLAPAAGFELGTGMAINPVTPEHAAARLRAAIAGDVIASRL